MVSLCITLITLNEFVDKVEFAPQKYGGGRDRALEATRRTHEVPQGNERGLVRAQHE